MAIGNVVKMYIGLHIIVYMCFAILIFIRVEVFKILELLVDIHITIRLYGITKMVVGVPIIFGIWVKISKFVVSLVVEVFIGLSVIAII
jgi:hypothetical protein